MPSVPPRPERSEPIQGLTRYQRNWVEVEPTERVRGWAYRLLRVHPLRTTDALQLAAAMVACEGAPQTLPFICFDERLRSAAGREGFALYPTRLP